MLTENDRFGRAHPVLHTYTPGRGTRLADKLFTGIREGAVMMTDGYEPYNNIARRRTKKLARQRTDLSAHAVAEADPLHHRERQLAHQQQYL